MHKLCHRNIDFVFGRWFVRVEKAFFVQSKDNTAIQIKAGTKLELDRYLPSQGLIAKFIFQTFWNLGFVMSNHDFLSKYSI
jgi:hypothetical protein